MGLIEGGKNTFSSNKPTASQLKVPWRLGCIELGGQTKTNILIGAQISSHPSTAMPMIMALPQMSSALSEKSTERQKMTVIWRRSRQMLSIAVKFLLSRVTQELFPTRLPLALLLPYFGTYCFRKIQCLRTSFHYLQLQTKCSYSVRPVL